MFGGDHDSPFGRGERRAPQPQHSGTFGSAFRAQAGTFAAPPPVAAGAAPAAAGQADFILSIDTGTSVPVMRAPTSLYGAGSSHPAPPPPPAAQAAVTSPMSAPVSVTPSRAATAPMPVSSPADGKASVEEQTFVDEFGFQLRDEAQAEEERRYVRNLDGEQVRRREVKWESMTTSWDRTNATMFDKMKERCRKGIPSKMRGIAWQLLSRSAHEMTTPGNFGVYQSLLKKKPDPEIEGLISRDLGRTFPTHSLFRDSDGVGQSQLRNILQAYAAIDPEVGYVQGMGFLVGTLMTQMKEEEAFWTLHQMMHGDVWAMRELFRPGFPMLQLCFFQLRGLLRDSLPKLGAYLDEIGCDPAIYASQWFLTLFVYHFPFRAVLRLWDIFMCEGWKIIFRTGLALLKWEEKNILGQPLDVVMRKMKTLTDGKNPDEIIERALKYKFHTADLLKYRQEYERQLAQNPQGLY